MANNPANQSIDIGRFRSRPSFLNNSPTSDGAGGQIENYTAFLTCWGLLSQNTGSRLVSQNEIILDNFYTLIVRYQDALATNLKSNTLIQVGSRLFTIQSTTKIQELDYFYSFTLVQKDH